MEALTDSVLRKDWKHEEQSKRIPSAASVVVFFVDFRLAADKPDSKPRLRDVTFYFRGSQNFGKTSATL
jgi:hypothetical protein